MRGCRCDAGDSAVAFAGLLVGVARGRFGECAVMGALPWDGGRLRVGLFGALRFLGFLWL